MSYIYNDEDNAPMQDDAWAGPHNPTVYGSRQEMRAAESRQLPFEDRLPADGCWNCYEYDGTRCHRRWNNNDPEYYDPDLDDKEPTDYCDSYTKDDSVRWEDFVDEC